MEVPLKPSAPAPEPGLYDVIISGGGPVGLFLASELALAQCTVLLLEQDPDPHSPLKRPPFGIRGLSAPTIEALDRRGLLPELQLHKALKNPQANAGQGTRRQVGHFAGIPFHDGDIDASQWPYRLPGSTPTSLISSIEELETLMARRAAALGVDSRRGLAVTAFDETEEQVVVQAGGQSFRGRWLVGCDGSRSVVRKLGGFDFAGTEPQFTGYTVQAYLADPEKLRPGRQLTPAGIYVQAQPGYLMLQDFDSGAAHDARQPLTLEHVQAVLRRISGTDVTIWALHLATTWTDRARQASTYRRGRVLLAGDAAHIHAPLGGQGLNLGLGDALNLGWKLAATVHGHATAGLLDSYTTERHLVGAQILNWSRAQVAVMDPSPQARALNAIIRELMETRDGATYFAGRVWGLHLHYDLGSTHPLVGRSVPNVEMADGTTVGVLLHDGCGLLLDFEHNPSLEALARVVGGRLKYVPGPAQEALGLRAVLVRPDGIVAWAADRDYRELEQAATRWFACPKDDVAPTSLFSAKG